jgi:Radical SAM superfamily
MGKPHAEVLSRGPRPPRVLVLELLCGAPGRGWYDRFVKLPSFFGIMAQAVAVWAEELGCLVSYRTYTGNESVRDLLSGEWDIAFLSAYTRTSYAAYAISHELRAAGVVTALGGPHAVAYPEDSARYFDYVLGITDRDTVARVIDERHAAGKSQGVRLASARHPARLPGLRRRQKYLECALEKTRFVRAIPLLASYGCPFKCEFCSDARVDFQPLPLSDIEDDIGFAARQYPHALLVWMDPNFGVAFDSLIDVIERAAGKSPVRFAAQTSLSLLDRERLTRLAHARFEVIVPGLESWFSCEEKLGPIGRRRGLDRAKEAAAFVNDILKAITYVQVNFVFGLEDEPILENFDLTAEFVRAAPGAWPTFNLMTAWGASSPLSERLLKEGRILPVPFPLLDQKSCSNVMRTDGSTTDLFRGLVGLEETAFGAGLSWQRARSSRSWGTRLINFIRGRGSEMRERIRWHRQMLRWLEHDRAFRAFFEGDAVRIPSALCYRALASMGPFVEWLPREIAEELKVGTPRPRWQDMP